MLTAIRSESGRNADRLRPRMQTSVAEYAIRGSVHSRRLQESVTSA